jgi:acetyltransferase
MDRQFDSMLTRLATRARALGAAFPAPPGEVWIRPLRAGDAHALAGFLQRLSLRSRHARFHVGIRDFPPQMIERYMRIDAAHELALVAGRGSAGQETLIAEARYAVSEEVAGAHEAALVVDDAVQGSGVGERLLRALIDHARCRGVARLIGDVLYDNRPMLALAAKLGFSIRRHPGDARLSRVALELGVASATAARHDESAQARAIASIAS